MAQTNRANVLVSSHLLEAPSVELHSSYRTTNLHVTIRKKLVIFPIVLKILIASTLQG